jgi:hypothetical protein
MCPTIGRVPTFLTNIKQYITGTNAPAYFFRAALTEEIVFKALNTKCTFSALLMHVCLI